MATQYYWKTESLPIFTMFTDERQWLQSDCQHNFCIMVECGFLPERRRCVLVVLDKDCLSANSLLSPRPGTQLQQSSFTSVLIRHWREFGSGPPPDSIKYLPRMCWMQRAQLAALSVQYINVNVPGIGGIRCFLARSRLFVNMIILQLPIKSCGRLMLDCKYHTYFCV